MPAATNDGYIHGFTGDEAARLAQQAEFLADWVFADLPLDDVKTLLEVGVGVGAETQIMRRRWPQLQVTGVDVSPSQLEHAAQRLSDDVAAGAVRLVHAAGDTLPLPGDTFDAAGFIWVLEHVPDPQAVVREAARCLRPGGMLFAREVYNTSAHTNPYEPALVDYFSAVGRLQRKSGGNPEIAAMLPMLMERAGLEVVSFDFFPILADGRDPVRRNLILRYFEKLFGSVAPQLRDSGELTDSDFAETAAAFERLRANPESLCCYTFGRMLARKPK